MHNKGRAHKASGSDHGLSKLTGSDIRKIRADRRRQWEIALDFGIVQANVSLIKNRKAWGHIK